MVQDPNSVGTALRTISLRLRGTSVTVLEEMGEETDGVVESVSKLQSKIKALSGVNILTDSGAYKDTYTILKEIGAVWEDMADVDQAALLELMAGKNRANTLSAILSNMKDLEGAYETAMGAEGSALKENEAYLDSIQGRIDLFTNSIQTMWMNLIDSDVVKDIVDLGTALINLTDKVGILKIALAGVAVYWTAIKKNNPVTVIKDLSISLQNYGAALNKIKSIQALNGINGSTKIDQQQFNTQNINAYAAAVSNLTAKQQASALASAGLTKSQIQQAMAANGVEKANIQQAMSEAQVTAEKTKSTVITAAQAAEMWANNEVKLSEVSANWLLTQGEQQLTLAKIQNAVASGDLTAAQGAEIISTFNLTTATNGAALAFKGLGASIKSMMASNPIGWIMLAISAVVAITQKIKHAKEEVVKAVDETINKYKEAQSELKSTKSTIDSISEEYEKLSKGVDSAGNNISLTTDEYERYNEICNQIADMFPSLVVGFNEQGAAVLSCKGNVEELTKAYNEAAIAANNAIIAGGSDIFNNFKDSARDLNNSSWFDIINPFNNNDMDYDTMQIFDKILNSSNIDEAISKYAPGGTSYLNKIAKALEDAGLERKTGSWWNPFDSESNYDFVKRAIQENRSVAQSIVSNFDSDVQTEISKMQSLAQAYINNALLQDYSGMSSDMQAVVKSMVSQFDFDFYNQFDSLNDMYAYLSDMLNKFNNLSEKGKIALKSLSELQTSFTTGDISYDDFKKQLKSIVDQLSTELSDEDLVQIKLMLGIDEESITVLANHARALLQNEFENKIGTLSLTDLKIVGSIPVEERDLLTWDELLTKIEEVKNAAIQDFDISNYKDSISNISESISTYKEALDSLESGSFTMEDFIELIEQFPDLAKGVDVSTKSFKGLSTNLKKAIRNSPKGLINDLKELRENLIKVGKSTTGIDQLIDSMENLPVDTVTSLSDEYITLADAIDKAKVAQNELQEAMNENPNEGFETRGDAIEQMKTLMEDGKIGSESELWSIAEAFGFTYDSAKTINENADALARFIAAREEWYATDDDGNYTYEGTESFLNDVEKVVASNKQLQNLGVKWNYNDETGSLDFDFNNADWDEIVKILGESEELAGLTSEEFYDLLMQVGQFFDINWQDADDLIYFLNQINKGTDSVSENFEQAENAVSSFLESQGYSSDLLELNVDDEEFKALPEEIQMVLQKYYELKKQFEEDPLSINWQLDKNSGKVLGSDSLESLSQLTTIVQEKTSGTVFIDYTNLKEAAKEAGYTEEAIDEIINKIKEYNNVCGIETSNDDPLGLVGLKNNAEKTEQYLTALQVKFETIKNADNTVSFKVETESIIDALIAQGWTAEDIQTYLTTLENSGTYSFTIDGAEVQLSTNDAQEKLTNLITEKQAMSEGETTEYTVTGTGEASVDHIKAMWDSMPTTKSTNYSIYETTYKNVVSTGSEADGTAHAQGTAFKTGTWGASETESALVGELGPELLVRNGRWTTVGENGAEFTEIKKGDIIFNHKQTEDLLKHGYVTSRGKAYVNGTAYASGSGTYSKYLFSGSGGYTKYDVNDEIVSSWGNVSSAANSLSDSADDLSDAADKFEEVFDWVEVRLGEIDERLSLREAQIENAVYYNSKNDIIDDMIGLNITKIANLTAGMQKYSEYAAKLLAEVPAQYQEAAQNGAIAITEFAGKADEVTVKAIENYREWAQKVADLRQELEETKTTIRDLAIQRIDNAYEFGDVRAAIEDSQTQKLQNAVDYDEERGLITSGQYYTAMMENSNKKIEYWTESLKAMQEEFNKAVENGEIEVGSNEWYEQINQLYEVSSEIDNATKELEEFQNAINDIYWDNFDELINRIDYLYDETENLISLMDKADMVTKPEGRTYEGGTIKYWTADDVEWTKEGIATLGLYAQQMEIAEYKAKQYAKAIDDLTKDYQDGKYSENEYLEKLNELKDAQYDSIEAYYDAQNAIKDLNSTRIDSIKDGIQKQIDAYEELINKQKEELDAEKDLHDFQKSIADQQKNISDIERKLAALANDNSISATAQRKRLEAELAEAQYELEEMYYDRSVEDKQDALDKELDSFQKEKEEESAKWDEYLENIEQIVADSLNVVQANASDVYNTLNDKANEYNLTLSDAILTPWKDGALAVSDYQSIFDTAASSTTDQLIAMESQWQKIIDRMNEAAEAEIRYQNEVNASYAAAKKLASATVDTKPSNSNSSNGVTNVSSGTSASSSGSPSVGSSVTVKSSATNFSGNSGGVRMASFVPGGTYTVYQVSGGQVLIGRGGVYTGWVNKSDLVGYAKGTLGVNEDQFAWLDELGEEIVLNAGPDGRLQYLSKGTSVIPHDLSENLMKWGALDPQAMLDQNRPAISAPHIVNNSIELTLNVEDIVRIDTVTNDTIPDLTKAVEKQLDKYMKNLNAQVRKYSR